ncbi:unnamed protein product [Urochloa humidicola]
MEVSPIHGPNPRKLPALYYNRPRPVGRGRCFSLTHKTASTGVVRTPVVGWWPGTAGEGRQQHCRTTTLHKDCMGGIACPYCGRT